MLCQPLQASPRSAASPNTTVTSSGTTGRRRRTRVPEKPHYPLNLWSIMKNCIGKELSKIPMPVNFSEPLSMLQRLTEDYEYADILDKVRREPVQPTARIIMIIVFLFSLKLICFYYLLSKCIFRQIQHLELVKLFIGCFR